MLSSKDHLVELCIFNGASGHTGSDSLADRFRFRGSSILDLLVSVKYERSE